MFQLDLPNRRLRVPHHLVVAGVERAIASDPLVTSFSLEVTEEGYLARVGSAGEDVTVLVRPLSVTYATGALTLRAETPRGVRVENRPAAHALIAAMTIFFGGTRTGQQLLSPDAIAGLDWNGLEATWTVPVDGVMAASGVIGRRARLTLSMEHTNEGLWLALPPGAGVKGLLTTLGRALRDRGT